MRLSDIRWGTVCGLAVAAEVVLIAAAVLYMVIYGGLNPGHPEEFYQRHVRSAAPILSIAVGMPLFFLLARWLARRAAKGAGKANAIALWVVWAVLDTAFLCAAGGVGAIAEILPFWLASYTTKLAGAWAGQNWGQATQSPLSSRKTGDQ